MFYSFWYYAFINVMTFSAADSFVHTSRRHILLLFVLCISKDSAYFNNFDYKLTGIGYVMFF
jgi:hypothetical protein